MLTSPKKPGIIRGKSLVAFLWSSYDTWFNAHESKTSSRTGLASWNFFGYLPQRDSTPTESKTFLTRTSSQISRHSYAGFLRHSASSCYPSLHTIHEKDSYSTPRPFQSISNLKLTNCCLPTAGRGSRA